MIRNHIVYNPVASEWKLEVTKAQGPCLWDENKKQLIDFTSGWNVANLGWNRPEVNDAIARQSKNNVYVPMETSGAIQEAYAEEFAASLPAELNAFCRATGGTEANEIALKIARAATGRKKIIGFRDTYHGQSFGAMSIGYRPEYVEAISPLVPEFVQIDFPSAYNWGLSDSETLAKFLTTLEGLLKKKDVAAIVTEAGIVTGWGSTKVAPVGYLKAVRKLTAQYGTLMILDEVGTGFSRTGTLFGMQHEGVVPDIATFAKGITNGGAAMGTTAVKREIVEPVMDRTNITSTFGWTSVACAAALATLRIHKKEKVWEMAEKKGAWLQRELTTRLSDHPKFGCVRGMGMEVGLVFVTDKKTRGGDGVFGNNVVGKARAKGLFMVYGDEGSIQLMPPLTMPQDVLAEGVDILVDAAQSIHE